MKRNGCLQQGFPGGSDDKASAYNVGDLGSISGSRRSPGEGNGNALQYSCLENPMDRVAWQATVHEVTESWTRLSDFTHFAHSNQCEVVPRSFDLHFSNKITFLSKTQKT